MGIVNQKLTEFVDGFKSKIDELDVSGNGINLKTIFECCKNL